MGHTAGRRKGPFRKAARSRRRAGAQRWPITCISRCTRATESTQPRAATIAACTLATPSCGCAALTRRISVRSSAPDRTTSSPARLCAPPVPVSSFRLPRRALPLPCVRVRECVRGGCGARVCAPPGGRRRAARLCEPRQRHRAVSRHHLRFGRDCFPAPPHAPCRCAPTEDFAIARMIADIRSRNRART